MPRPITGGERENGSSDVWRKSALICRNAENRPCLAQPASRNCKRVHPSRYIKFISSDPVDFSRCPGHWRKRCHVPRISVCRVAFYFQAGCHSVYIHPRYVREETKPQGRSRESPVGVYGIRDYEFRMLAIFIKTVA